MGTNSQITTAMETQNDVPAPAQFSDDTAVCIASVKGLKENWQKWSSEHQEYQKHNPFSHDTRPSVVVPQRGQDDYGRPLQGSMTEQRGKDAHTHISREVEELCEVIRNIGEPREKDGDGSGSDVKVTTVEFGKLFEHYVTISNKLVGILLRARKQKLVDFEGEMLWQGQDDRVVITLLQWSETWISVYALIHVICSGKYTTNILLLLHGNTHCSDQKPGGPDWLCFS